MPPCALPLLRGTWAPLRPIRVGTCHDGVPGRENWEPQAVTLAYLGEQAEAQGSRADITPHSAANGCKHSVWQLIWLYRKALEKVKSIELMGLVIEPASTGQGQQYLGAGDTQSTWWLLV